MILIVHIFSIFLYLLAGNLPCPQPQTAEHLAAVELMKIDNVLILQSKIDFLKDSDVKEHYEQILAFTKGRDVCLIVTSAILSL